MEVIKELTPTITSSSLWTDQNIMKMMNNYNIKEISNNRHLSD
jgi:hypothetical protein